MAAVINGTASSGSLYIDGVNFATAAGIGSIDSNRVVYLGSFADGQAKFNGMLDEVRIDALERSSNWVWATWLNAASNQTFAVFGAATATVQGSLLILR